MIKKRLPGLGYAADQEIGSVVCKKRNYSFCAYKLCHIPKVRVAVVTPIHYSPKSAAKLWRRYIRLAPWYDEAKEMAVVLILNTKLQVTAFSLISIGTLNESIVHARDVFRPAIALNAYSIALMHNHPSGDPKPSKADLELTTDLREAGKLIGIFLEDHIIIGAGNLFFSFDPYGIASAASRLDV
ncbi:MAG TPA: JAB domain-containing protein [Chthoniobacterales bacterium]|nr:JAB domain-containing protein [Chthoniobacterales bacterium]